MRNKKKDKRESNAENKSIPALINEVESALSLLEKKIIYYANLNSEFYSDYNDVKRLES